MRPSGALEVLPDNWAAVRVFVAMGTQWRRAGMSAVATGLEYAALPAVCGALGVTLDDDLLSRVQMIERAAITTMLEKRS